MNLAKEFMVGIRLGMTGGAQTVAGVKSVEKSLAGIKAEANKVGDAAGNLRTKLTQLAAVIGIGLSVREFVQQADAMALLDARLRNAVGGGEKFAASQLAVYEIAQKNNIGLQEATQLYIRLAAPVLRLGGTTKEVTGITNAFAMSLRVGGASAQEAASATLQFAQAMGSGKLSGDEFRAMAEASPRFMQALAEGMNVPIETLKKMGSEGKLTADVVGNALLKSLGKLSAEAKTLPDTVGGAMTRIKNDVLVAISDLNKSSGITLGIAGMLELVRTDLLPAIKDELANAFETVGTFIKDNRAQLEDAWVTVKALTVDLFEIAKVVGGVVVATAAWAVQSGVLQKSLEFIRILVAGLQDGVEILGAAFAYVGARLLTIAGIVNPAFRAMAVEADNYAAAIFQKFADGGSAAQKLSVELNKTRADTAALRVAMAAGTISTSENGAEMAKLSRQAEKVDSGYKKLKSSIKAQTEAEKEAIKAHEKLIESFGKLSKKTEEKLRESATELAVGRKLTDAEQDYVKAMLAVASGKVKMIELEKDGTLARLKANLVTSAAVEEETKLKEAKEKLIVTMAAVAAHSRKLNDEEAKATESLREGNVALIEQNETMLLSEAALVDRQAKLLLSAAAAKEWEAAERGGNYQLEEQARLLRARAGLLRDNAVLKEAKAAADEWQRVSEEIGQGLTDSLFRAFEAGRGFFDTLWSGIKNLFKTTVLRLILNPVQQGITSYVGGLLGGGQSTLGQVGQAASLYNALSSGSGYAGAAGTAIFGSNAAYGAAIGTTNIGAGSQAAMLAAQTGEFGLAGATATSQAAAGAGSGAASMASYAGWAAAIALGVYKANSDWEEGFRRDQAKDAMGPVGDIYYGLASFASKVGFSDRIADLFSGATAHAKLFGRAAPRVTSSGVQGSIGGGEFTGTAYADILEKGGLFRSDKRSTETTALTSEIDRFFDGAAAGIMDKAKEYGDALGLPVGALAGVTSDIKIELGADAEANKAAILTALGGYGDALVAGWADALKPLTIYGETTIQTIERVGAAILNVNTVLDLIGVSALSASIDGGAAAMALSDAFGGLDGLAQASAGYFDAYFDSGEKAARATEQLTKALDGVGIDAVPATRAAFRQLVEGLDLTTEAGRNQFVTLMNVSGSFAELHPEIDATAEAAKAAEEAMRAAAGILKEREGLEVRLLQMQGDTVALRERERAALDETNRALYDQITALEDSQAAAAAQAQAAAAAIAIAAQVADERAGLERQLLELQGDTAAIRALERAALDESNRALYDRIVALQDEQAAAVASQVAMREAAEAAAGAAQSLAAAMAAALGLLEASVNDAYAGVKDSIAAAQSEITADMQAVTSARDALVRDADAQIKALDQQANDATRAFAAIESSLGGLVDSLNSIANDITASLDGGKAAREQALATLRAQLHGAIDVDAAKAAAATASKISAGDYSNATDFKRDSYRTAALVGDVAQAAASQVSSARATMDAQLAAIAAKVAAVEADRGQQLALLDEQLATMTRQMRVLDEQLITATSQYEALLGIDSSVLSVGSAIGSLAGAMSAYASAIGGAMASSTSGGAAISGAQSATNAAIRSGVVDTSSAKAWMQTLADDPRVGYDWAVANGVHSSTVDAVMGWAEGSAAQWAKDRDLPAFAAGGLHSGGLRLVGENGPEIEATGASRVWSAADTANMLGGGGRRDEVLVAEIKALRQEVAALRSDNKAQQGAIATNTNKTARLIDKWDTEGMPLETTA